jgi:hypothetical protein|tara:strand:- start:3485 stop:3763 length:279 start_codon:yes stop_codon:yes gene_type:complete
MYVVWRADGYSVQTPHCQQVMVVRKNRRVDTVSIGKRLRRTLRDICKCYDLNIWNCAAGKRVRVRDTPRTDDTDTDFLVFPGTSHFMRLACV